METILTADIGNSNIVLGCFEADALAFTERLITRRKWTRESMAHEILRLLTSHGVDPASVSGGIISSVVPELDPILGGAIERATGSRPLQMDNTLNTGIGTHRYDVSTLGEDRLVDLAAAAAVYGAPAAVYDLGTCTTLSVIDADANLIGGMISAGVQLSLDAQAERTSQLPQLTAGPVDRLLGQDTVSNMISGSVASTGIMMDGVIRRIREDYHLPDLKVIVTGGNGKVVLPWIRGKVIYDPDLLLKGMLVIYRMNREKM